MSIFCSRGTPPLGSVADFLTLLTMLTRLADPVNILMVKDADASGARQAALPLVTRHLNAVDLL